jgi:hypothetical protein
LATTLIVSCAGGRLRELLLALETRLGVDGADRLLVPGGPLAFLEDQRARATMIEWLDLLVRGHTVELVCLVAHEDCLAYSGRLEGLAGHEREVLERDLMQVKTLVAARHPSVRVECFVVPHEPGPRPGRLTTPERVAL